MGGVRRGRRRLKVTEARRRVRLARKNILSTFRRQCCCSFVAYVPVAGRVPLRCGSHHHSAQSHRDSLLVLVRSSRLLLSVACANIKCALGLLQKCRRSTSSYRRTTPPSSCLPHLKVLWRRLSRLENPARKRWQY